MLWILNYFVSWASETWTVFKTSSKKMDCSKTKTVPSQWSQGIFQTKSRFKTRIVPRQGPFQNKKVFWIKDNSKIRTVTYQQLYRANNFQKIILLPKQGFQDINISKTRTKLRNKFLIFSTRFAYLCKCKKWDRH